MRTRRLLLIVLVGIWVGVVSQNNVVLARTSHVCSEMCGGSTCDEECWATQFEYDNEYPSTTCGDEGFECCGDGVCNPQFEACNACVDDCDYVPYCPGVCYTDSQCPSGETCNASQECVERSPVDYGDDPLSCGGACSGDGDCCGYDVCMGTSGQKYCATPSTQYCSSAQSCSSSYDCDTWGNATCGLGNYEDMYCNPGSGQCEFHSQPTCVDSSSVCK